MRISTSVLICLFIACSQANIITAEATGVSNNAVIAVIDTTEGRLPDLEALLTARLSREANLNLVERKEIDAILKELELSAAQFVNRENTLKLGHLLGADGLVFLSLSDDAKLVRVRLVDTRYGLRLLDTLAEWKREAVARIADEIVPLLSSASSKLLIRPEDEILVGILGIRNVDLSSALNYLEISLPGFISSRLSQEPRIIVLEREDLNLVLEEKLFAKGTDTKFLGSMALLEGEVKQVSTKDEYGFSLNLRLKQVDGKLAEDLKIKGNTEKLPALAEEVAVWLVKTVADAPPKGSWDIKKEAERFRREGMLLIGHNDPAGIALLETALALDRNQTATRKKLIDILALSLNEKNARRFMNLMCLNYASGFTSPEDNWRMSDLMGFLIGNRMAEPGENPDMKSLRKEAFDFCVTIWSTTKSGSEAWRHFMPAQWAPVVCSSLDDAIGIYRRHIVNVMELVDRGDISLRVAMDSLYFVMTSMYHPLYKGCPWSLEEQKSAFRKMLRPYLSSNRVWFAYMADLASFENEPSEETLAKCLNIINDFKYPDKPEDVKAWLGDNLWRLSCPFPGKFPKEVQFETPRTWLLYLAHLAYYKHNPNEETLENCLSFIFDDFKYPDEPEDVKVWLRATFAELCTINSIRLPETEEFQFEALQQLLTPLIQKHDYITLDSFWAGCVLVNRLIVQHGRKENLRDLTIAVVNELKVLGHGKSNNLFALEGGLTRLYANHPELRPKTGTTALTCKILYKYNDDLIKTEEIHNAGHYYLPSFITFQENALWICLGTTRQSENIDCVLLRVDPVKKEVNKRWYFKIRNNMFNIYHYWEGLGFDSFNQIAGLSVSSNIVYMAVPGTGIIFFDIEKTMPGKNCAYKVLTTKEKLSGNNVTGIFVLGNKLYLGFGGKDGGGFGVYDLTTREMKMLANSRAREGKCPLDNSPPYAIRDINNYENKLFFIASGEAGGLWKYEMDTDALTQIISVGEKLHVGGTEWYLSGGLRLSEGICGFFDPKTEILQIILAGSWPPRLSEVYMRNPNCIRYDKQFASFYDSSGGAPAQYIDHTAFYDNKVWFLINQAGLGLASKNQGDGAETMKVYDERLLGGVQPFGAFASSFGLIVWGKDTIGLLE
ncbi:MAG: CsgG/HfaB family protein [Verrucomicrobia bacterium]|nr:CsgG/HfaB family protein [Verrucomicrobiota bacterium]MBU1734046.1 CsgG/HfaB family protein [Verrucomicrobiota bacterium]MBU1857537.1 CsgG/HfaB family protein [Verrucomicrobiota bacterium]